MTHQFMQARRADFASQAGEQSRPTAVLSGIAAAVLLLGVPGGGYLWGRSTEAAEVRDASDVICAALSDGSASARAWADAIRRNNLVDPAVALQGTRGRAETGGRQVCAVPLWLDNAPPPASPAGPRS
ncbi:hypothetical protein [Roseomonas sp. WA12]